jgi:hypothetical protein
MNHFGENMGTWTQPDPPSPWTEIIELKRKLQQIRMTVFSPEYLATHDKFTEADQTALITAILERSEDTLRMDWLDTNCDEIFVTRDVTAGTTHRLTFCALETGCCVEKSGKTLRDVVDLGMEP